MALIKSWEEKIANYRSAYDEWDKRRSKHLEYYESERYQRYLKYLNSDAWAKKRDMVLRRDNYLCQACLVNRATQAHHLTYSMLGREPLFDLIAVCAECHKEIHKEHERF